MNDLRALFVRLEIMLNLLVSIHSKFQTWKIRRALGKITEDSQTRYSQQERMSDGWQSPIWDEHHWSLDVFAFPRGVRKSSSSTIGVLGSPWQKWDVRSHACVVAPHPPTAPLCQQDRRCCCCCTSLLSGWILNCVLLWVGVEAAYLELCRSPAGSQRPGVPRQAHDTIPTTLNTEIHAPQSITDVIISTFV